MPFLYETLKPTYIVHCGHPVDEEAAKIIAKRTGFPILLTSNVKDPSIPDPIYDENNLILVAGWLANPYTAYHFPDLTADVDPVTGDLVPPLYGIPGWYSEDGRRVISTITRPNGTTVTVVSGIAAEDTLQAAKDYTKTNLLPIVGAIAAEIIAIVAVAKVK